jgi:hypothetical protein
MDERSVTELLVEEVLNPVQRGLGRDRIEAELFNQPTHYGLVQKRNLQVIVVGETFLRYARVVFNRTVKRVGRIPDAQITEAVSLQASGIKLSNTLCSQRQRQQDLSRWH